MPSCALYMTTYPPFKTTTLSIYDITCPLLKTWHTLYMTCYLLCMISRSPYVWHHTMPVSLTSHTLCLWHIHLIQHHTQCYDNQRSHNFTATMSDITPTVSVSSHPLDQFYQNQCMYDIIATVCMTSYALHVTSHPQFRISHHLMYDIRSILSDLTSTVSLSSHPPYRWYHSHMPYIYDIISTKYDITTLCVDDTTLGIYITSFALQMKTHPLYHTKPQYLWCHVHFRHDNTAPVSDIAPILSMSSYRLHWHLTHFCMISHPPSVQHHMNYI